MAKIVTVYVRSIRETDDKNKDLVPIDMSYIRWYKISEALAKFGHQVDMAVPDIFKEWKANPPLNLELNLRRIPLSEINWDDYDIVKTLFNAGFQTLEAYGGTDHPCIISKLGSVVGPHDMDGIYFYGTIREQMYSIQEKIHEKSKYVTVLTKQARDLWYELNGANDNLLIVPGAVDRHIPPRKKDPYPTDHKKRCLFAGNFYNDKHQPEANKVIVERLNILGKLLSSSGISLYLLGPGDASKINNNHITYLGKVPYEKTWDYLYHADIGIVVAAGRFMHNNESSKIYHYLRVGLPVVCESGFPNDYVVTESNLGVVVDNGNLELMAEKIKEAAQKEWDRDSAINYILNNHTWEKRVEIYDEIIKQNFTHY